MHAWNLFMGRHQNITNLWIRQNTTIPSLVAEGQQLSRYHPDENSLELWTFPVTLTLTSRSIQSFHKIIHLKMMCHQAKFSCKRISSSGNTLKSQILIILSLTVTLTLKTANLSVWKTISLIMMHHHTKFGSKSFSDSEDIIWTNINWPWTKQSSFSIEHSGL